METIKEGEGERVVGGYENVFFVAHTTLLHTPPYVGEVIVVLSFYARGIEGGRKNELNEHFRFRSARGILIVSQCKKE